MSASWIAPDALSSRASLYWPSSTWILATGIGSLQGCAGSVIGTSDPCSEHFDLVSQPVDEHLVRSVPSSCGWSLCVSPAVVVFCDAAVAKTLRSWFNYDAPMSP